MAPNCTIASQQIEGNKKNKSSMTVVLCSNSTGSNKRIIFIGHAAKPQAFKGKKAENHSFYYCANKKAWMTSMLFQEYFKQLNSQIS